MFVPYIFTVDPPLFHVSRSSLGWSSTTGSHINLVCKAVHVLLSSGPSYAMLYTLTKEKGSYWKSYVHDITNGGDPAIWQYVTM